MSDGGRRLAWILGVAGLAATGVALAGDRPWDVRWLQPLFLLWAAAVAVGLARDRAALGWFVVALVVRVLWFAPRVLSHYAKALLFLVPDQELMGVGGRYGDAQVSLSALVERVWGWSVDLPHQTAVVLSAVAVASLHLVVRRATGRPAAAHTAAALATTLPLLVALAPTPQRFGLVAVLQITALAALLDDDRITGDIAAVAAIALLAHARPLQLGVAALLVGVAMLQRRPRVVIAAGVLVAARAASLLAFLNAGGDASGRLPYARSLQAMQGLAWDRVWVVLDPHRVPAALVPLGLVGLAAWWRRDARGAAPLTALLAVGSLLYVEQHYPSDQLRFQLPSVWWWAAAAGIGLDAVARRHRGAALALGVALLASYVPARAPLQPPFAWQAAYPVLRRAAEVAPEGAVVRYSDVHDPDGGLARWTRAASVAAWLPLDGPAPQGALRWVGPGDHHPEAQPVPWDRLVPVVAWSGRVTWGRLPPPGARQPPPDGVVRFGLFQVRAAP